MTRLYVLWYIKAGKDRTSTTPCTATEIYVNIAVEWCVTNHQCQENFAQQMNVTLSPLVEINGEEITQTQCAKLLGVDLDGYNGIQWLNLRSVNPDLLYKG